MAAWEVAVEHRLRECAGRVANAPIEMMCATPEWFDDCLRLVGRAG